MSRRDPRSFPEAAHPADDAAFQRWLNEGMETDARDHAAGRMVAEAWRDRRRAIDHGAASTATAMARRRRLRWWAPLALAAVAAIAVVAWPSPAFVDGDALAGAYLEAMGALSEGWP